MSFNTKLYFTVQIKTMRQLYHSLKEYSMNNIKKYFVKKRKGNFKRRLFVFVEHLIIISISVLGIFSFSNVPYLSDATFIFATWSVVSVIFFSLFVFIVYKYYPKNKKKLRKFVLTLSGLGFLMMAGRTIYFSLVEEDRSEQANYSELMPSEKLASLLGTSGELMAGAAKGEITPTKELFPMPLLFILKFREVNDSVFSRVLAFSDGKEQYLYISLDMTLVPEAEKTLDFINKETGIPKKNILITATHTHGVTPISLIDYKSPLDKMKVQKWYNQIKNTLIKTIAEAQSKMVPAQYGYGEGNSQVNVNRDILEGDKSILGKNLDGYSDKTLRMVKIDDLNGNNIALIVNHATHGVVMNGAIKGPSTSLTGDLPGRSATKVEAKLNGGVVLWSSSAAGDQNPKIGAQGILVDEEGNHKRFMLGEKASSIVLEHLSDEHAHDILMASQKIVANQRDITIKTQLKTIKVEAEEGAEDRNLKLQVFMLGDIAFEGVSAEIVSSIGKKLLALSPYDHTILMTMMNGYEGYIADEWQYDHDAFENGSNLKRGEGEKNLVDGFIDLFEKLK